MKTTNRFPGVGQVTVFRDLTEVKVLARVGRITGSLWSSFMPRPLGAVVQSLSGVQLCDLADYSPPGSSVLHYLPEFAQIHVH